EQNIEAALPYRAASDHLDQPSGLVIASLDVSVDGIKRAAAGRQRVADAMHVAALVRHDVGERGDLSAAEIAEQVLDRDLLGEVVWVGLNLSHVRKWVVLHRIELGRVVVYRPIGETRARYRNVVQVSPPVLAGFDQLARNRRKLNSPPME